MGKSGSFFFFSEDRKFILKTIKKEEVKTLKSMLQNFYNHLAFTNTGTLLSKIYGLFTIEISGF